jgi:hypothetical protein
LVLWLHCARHDRQDGVGAVADQIDSQGSASAFFGPHEVEHGKVAYFAGENPDDLRERFIADLDLSPGVTVPDDAVRFFPLLFNADEAYDQIAGELTGRQDGRCRLPVR